MSTQFSHQIFDFAYIQGTGLSSQLASFPASDYDIHAPITGGKLFVSKNDKVQKKTDASGSEYFFIGDVFYFDDLQLEKSDGHFIGIKCDTRSETTTFFRNRNSHIGLYYAGDHTSSAIFSSLYRSQKKLLSYFGNDLSADALDDYFKYGFVTFGQTIYKKIKQVPFRKHLQLKNSAFTFSFELAVPIVDEILVNPKAFFDFFQERMEIWLRQASFNSIALSGGIDSRFLITCWLNKKIDRPMTLHSRLHPKLEANQDRDVMFATQVAALTTLPHAIQKAESLPTAFLSQDPPCRPPVMSGLYGGEYLGGEFLNLVPLAQWDTSPQGTGVFAETVLSRHTGDTYEDDVRLKLEILAQSSLCQVYDSAWASIATHHNLTLTPFWDTYFIEAISRMPAGQLRNYALYRRLYSFFPQNLRDIPLNSHMNLYFNDYTHALEGENPKHIKAAPSPTTITSETRDLLPREVKSNPSDAELLKFQKILGMIKIF